MLSLDVTVVEALTLSWKYLKEPHFLNEAICAVRSWDNALDDTQRHEEFFVQEFWTICWGIPNTVDSTVDSVSNPVRCRVWKKQGNSQQLYPTWGTREIQFTPLKDGTPLRMNHPFRLFKTSSEISRGLGLLGTAIPGSLCNVHHVQIGLDLPEPLLVAGLAVDDRTSCHDRCIPCERGQAESSSRYVIRNRLLWIEYASREEQS